jgi:hypothetical protein
MGFDDCVYHSELLSFWTLSIVQDSEEHNISETGGRQPTLLGPSARANPNHWTIG